MKTVILALFWALFPLSAETFAEIEQARQSIRVLLERKSFEEALRQAQNLNRKMPDDVETYGLLTEAYLGLGKVKEAEAAAQWMLDLRIGKADAAGYRRISMVREALGDLEGAYESMVQAFQRTSAQDPGARVAILKEAGRLRIRAGHTAEGQAMLQEALKLDPVHVAAGDIQKMRETGDGSYLERAAKLLDGVLAKEPNHYEARRQRIEIELFRHEFDQVIADSERLIGERPGDSRNWATLGDALLEKGLYDRAEKAYEKLANLRSDLVSWNRIGFFRFVTGDTEGAVEAMERAVSAGGPQPEHTAWCEVELGNLYLKTGRSEEARRVYESALQRKPNYHLALAGLGKVAVEKGEFERAASYFEKAQRVVPMPEYAAQLTTLYERAGKVGEAEKQKALIDVADRLGRANGEKGNRTLALIYADQERNLGRALELAEGELRVRGDVYTYDALAWVLFKNGRVEEARSAMKKALALGTQEPLFKEHAAKIGVAESSESRGALPYSPR